MSERKSLETRQPTPTSNHTTITTRINWENRYCNDCNTILVDRRYVD